MFTHLPSCKEMFVMRSGRRDKHHVELILLCIGHRVSVSVCVFSTYCSDTLLSEKILSNCPQVKVFIFSLALKCCAETVIKHHLCTTPNVSAARPDPLLMLTPLTRPRKQ